MKKQLLVLGICLLLASCARPATSTDWSPINDVTTPRPTASATRALDAEPLQATQTATVESSSVPTPEQTLDLNSFPDPLPKSMKGYELYSWQSEGTWNFTLITGTNRSKSFEELMAPDSQVTADGFVKITVSGVDQIKQILATLPVSSEVLWTGMDLEGQVPEGTLYLTYPDKIVMDDLINYCAKHNINLETLAEAN